MKNQLIINREKKVFVLKNHFYGRIDDGYLYISDNQGQEKIALSDINCKHFKVNGDIQQTRILYIDAYYIGVSIKRWVESNYLPDIIFPTRYLCNKFLDFLNEQ